MRTPKTNVSFDRAAAPAEEKDANAPPRLLSAENYLTALVGERPKTKAGQVQWLWPQIKAALVAGHKIRQIWECLADDGLDITYARLRYYIARFKRQESHGVPMPTRDRSHQPSRTATSNPQVKSEGTGRDALANLRSRLNHRPGFQFDERPPDEKKLI
jgi:hypothetical protein